VIVDCRQNTSELPGPVNVVRAQSKDYLLENIKD
jgi:hypothetical protein